MIDPTKVETKGQPSRDKAREVYESLPEPSVRKCAEALRNMGYDIGHSTVQRWKKANWLEPPPATTQPNRRVVEKVMAAEIQKSEAAAAQQPAGIEGAVTGTTLTKSDLDRIEEIIASLKDKTIADLRDELERERVIFNIVLLREARRRANILALIPKDTSSLIVSYTDDAKAATPVVAPIEPAQPANAQPVGNGHAPMLEGEFQVVSPTAQAIQRYLAKENAA